MVRALEGKIAIVVGGSRGIGRAIVERFASEGAKVLVVATNDQIGQECVESVRKSGGVASFQKGNVTKLSDMENAVKVACSRYGTVHILAQNVGIYPTNYLEDMTESDWDSVLSTNLKGTFLAVKACLPVMKQQSYGKIVVTSSITGPKTGVPGLVHYG